MIAEGSKSIAEGSKSIGEGSKRIDEANSCATGPVDKATADDIAGIQKLVNHYSSMGDLLPRTKSDISNNLKHFRVIRQDNEVVACGSVSYTHLRAHETREDLVCRLLLEKKN